MNNSDHFKIKTDIDYYFNAGYRYYKVGTNTSTGTATLLADSSTLSVRFDSASITQLQAAAMLGGLLINIW